MKQKYEEFRKKCYEKYQLNWMLSHGYSLQNLIDAMNEKYMEDDSREYTTPGCYYEDVLDNDGFHGELFHYYDAFLEKEYLDGKYMKSILTGSEFQTWRDDTEQYETYPDLTVDTKIGKIYAKTVPGSFPGILIECETSNTAGTPGALLEYDETKKKMMLRVYGIQNPYGNPIEKDKIGTVICNMPTEKDAFAHFTYYYVYLTEDNPRYAISLIQKKMEDRVIFLQKETSRLNFNIQSLDKKIILLNEEKLEEHDKN